MAVAQRLLLTPWQPQSLTRHLSGQAMSVPPLGPRHPLYPSCPLGLPSGTAFRETKLAERLAGTARASLLGVRPAARLVPPGEACRHVPAGQAGPRAREA